MAASVHARIASDLPAGALYWWTEGREQERRWLLFSSADGTFTACDETGTVAAAAMSLNLETQDLRNPAEDAAARLSFVQVAAGIWKAFRNDGRIPRAVDRTFY